MDNAKSATGELFSNEDVVRIKQVLDTVFACLFSIILVDHRAMAANYLAKGLEEENDRTQYNHELGEAFGRHCLDLVADEMIFIAVILGLIKKDIGAVLSNILTIYKAKFTIEYIWRQHEYVFACDLASKIHSCVDESRGKSFTQIGLVKLNFYDQILDEWHKIAVKRIEQ